MITEGEEETKGRKGEEDRKGKKKERGIGNREGEKEGEELRTIDNGRR